MTRVAVVDEHRLLSASLAVALREAGLDAVTPWLSPLDALRDALVSMRPDVLVVAHDLGALGSGEDLIRPMSDIGSAVVSIVPTLDDVAVERSLRRGARACVSKTEPLEGLLRTVLALARGEPPVRVAPLDMPQAPQQTAAEMPADPFGLTPREATVLGQLMKGRTVADIARSSYVAEATVRTQVRSILAKLDVRSQVQAVALAARKGWEPPEGDGTRRPHALTSTARGT
jgi:two-component system nitrate/nitrite response regulator NarL